jgi:hypothetical protein
MEVESTSSKKRKSKWANGIEIEECAAKLLTDSKDREYCCDVVNYCYAQWSNITHNMTNKESSYVLQFIGPKVVDSKFLRGIVMQYKLIRNIVIKPVNAVDSEDSQPYFIIAVDIFSHNNDLNHVTIPTFQPYEFIPQQVTREMFASTVAGPGHENEWKDEWNLPFMMILDISFAIINKEQFPDDMSITLSYENTTHARVIYGIKLQTFGDIPYSLIEYLNDIKPTDYLYYIKFEPNKDNKNVMIIKLLEADKETSSKAETISGEYFFQNMPKRSVSPSSQDQLSSRHIPDEERTVKRDRSISLADLISEKKDKTSEKQKKNFLLQWLSES